MKIVELILELETVLNEHGNLDVITESPISISHETFFNYDVVLSVEDKILAFDDNCEYKRVFDKALLIY